MIKNIVSNLLLIPQLAPMFVQGCLIKTEKILVFNHLWRPILILLMRELCKIRNFVCVDAEDFTLSFKNSYETKPREPNPE